MIHDILDELNQSNSTNYKIAVLRKYKSNDFLQKIIKMTYDNVAYTYGVTLAQIEKFTPQAIEIPFNLELVLDIIQSNLVSRNVTGHSALQLAANLIGNLPTKDADLLKKIINRDLRINVGKTLFNKVWPGLITKPSYMRCDVYNKKSIKNISFPAILQLKADGSFREFTVDSNRVSARSRSGESYEYPIIFETMSWYPDGVYTGELTVKGHTDRAKSNGLINSDNPPHEDIVLELWDFIPLDEYNNACKKDKKNPNVTKYETRFSLLSITVKANEGKNVQIIPSTVVNSLQEALMKTSEYMNSGFEGAILKDMSGVFKDGTSKHQLKLKLKFSVDVRVIGYIEGTPGTSRIDTFGSIIYESDDKKITGSVSGFTDEELKEINSRREYYMGKIMEIEGNDLTKSQSKDTYTVSHPRFIEFRFDKDSSDDLQRILHSIKMSKNLS